MNTSSQDDTLQRETEKLLPGFIAIMFFMTIIGVIGVAGNIVTFFFYRGSQHTSTTVLIVGLAAVDFIVCCLSFTTLVDLAFIVTYVELDRYLCKIFFCSCHWMISSSAIILWMIAVDRYLKICRPQWKQLTVRTAYMANGASILLAFLVSVRNLFTYDTVVVPFTADGDIGININNASFIRYICTSTDAVGLRSLVLGFTLLEAVGGFGILLTFVFSYGNIVKKLREHNKTMAAAGINIKTVSNAGKTEQSVESETQSSGYPRSMDTKDSSSNMETADDKPNSVQSTSQNNDASNLTGTEVSNSQKTAASNTNFKVAVNEQRKSSSNRRQHYRQSERSLAIMMLAVTTAFFICFVPYFAVIVGIPSTVPGKQKLEAPIQFAVRSVFWNSAINPVIFCAFNSRYRQYVKNILKFD